jgi:roadblock/LC7 domain-containing protein
MASDGGRAAREAFTRDPWWHNEYQDGRRSVAMLELIDTARRLRGGGAKITVACFDMPATDPKDGQTRDNAMAQQVMALRASHPDAALVVYAGNIHTRRAGMARMPGYETMAMRMAKEGVAMVSLNANWAEGSAWVCTGATPSDCGPQFMGGRADERGIRLERSKDGAYDGWFGVGAITASPPAAFPELAAKLDAQLAGLGSSPSARRARAMRAYNAKQYTQCAAEFASITPPTADDVYGQACCLALAGNKDAAFERLRAAIDLGFKDAAEADADADLVSLRGDPRWPFAAKHE